MKQPIISFAPADDLKEVLKFYKASQGPRITKWHLLKSPLSQCVLTLFFGASPVSTVLTYKTPGGISLTDEQIGELLDPSVEISHVREVLDQGDDAGSIASPLILVVEAQNSKQLISDGKASRNTSRSGSQRSSGGSGKTAKVRPPSDTEQLGGAANHASIRDFIVT